MTSDYGMALNPFHVLQMICLQPKGRSTRILTNRADGCRKLFGDIPGLEFLPVEARREELDKARDSKGSFDCYQAMPWNRSSLLFAKAALRSGGQVRFIEDGIGNYPSYKRPFEWRPALLRIAYWILDGTVRHDHFNNFKLTPGVIGYSVRPELAIVKGVQKLDVAPLRTLLPNLERHFAHLEPFRGLPVFFDTNDCDNDWYPLDIKLELLKRLLPEGPVLYMPHPSQKIRLCDHLPNLIDLTGKTHGFNELACLVIRPPKIFSVFSTAALTLRYLLNLEFENVLLYQDFFKATGHPAFDPDPRIRDVLG